MNANTQKLSSLGTSIWIDNITREILGDGTLKRYIDELGVVGLTSNPTIFEQAMAKGDAYDDQIAELTEAGKSGEELFFELAIRDLGRAADLFMPVHESTGGVDGWVSLEVSPLLAADAKKTIESATRLHAQAGKRNLYIKIPGTPAGIEAIEAAIFAGVPVNVTLLFSREQYLAAAEAYMRGIERRIEKGLSTDVSSVASVFVSRWDVAVKDKVPAEMRNRLGVAISLRCYKAYRELLASSRWQKLAAAGAKPQRLLLASTGMKDPDARDTLYVEALAAPDTVDTMPDKTLKALADHGRAERAMPEDGGDAETVIAEFTRHGIDDAALAEQLQQEAEASFAKSWKSLLDGLEKKTAQFAGATSK